MSAPAAHDETLRVQVGDEVVTAIEFFLSPPSPGSRQDAASKGGSDTDGSLPRPVTASDGERVSDRQVERAATHLRDSLSVTTGFVGALLLVGQRGELVLYSQWKPQGDEPPVDVPAEWSLAPAVNGLDRIGSRTYAVDFTAPGEVSEASLKDTPHAHFGVFTVDPGSQEEMLGLARRHAPESMGTPGLRAINFHRSLDGCRVINLGLWSGFGDFDELLTRPSFAQRDEYWTGVATFRPHFFEVAAVVARAHV